MDVDIGKLIFEEILDSSSIPPVFDPIRGIGAVPFNQSVDYLGYRVKMSPEDFRKLTPEGQSSKKTPKFVEQELAKGNKIGNPFLDLKWDEDLGIWGVWGHEGRSRSDAFKKVFPGKDMEVHVFLKGENKKHLTDEQRKALKEPIYQENYEHLIGTRLEPYIKKVKLDFL